MSSKKAVANFSPASKKSAPAGGGTKLVKASTSILKKKHLQETEEKVETVEERANREAKEREDKRLRFIQLNCTTLRFFYNDSEKNREIVADRLQTYFDLQQKIASTNPKNKSLFCVRLKGTLISSDNFKPGPEFNVHEVFTKKDTIPSRLPALPSKWDFTHYHGKLKDWIDPAERARLRAEEEARKKAEEEARAGWEAELRFKEEQAKKAQSDKEWKALLGV